MYTCDEGYAHLQGVTVRYCEKGKWTEEAPTCTEIKNGMVYICTNRNTVKPRFNTTPQLRPLHY